MSEVVSAKFSQNPDLADKLLSTGDLDLREETNRVGKDRFWATDPGARSASSCGKKHVRKNPDGCQGESSSRSVAFNRSSLYTEG